MKRYSRFQVYAVGAVLSVVLAVVLSGCAAFYC